MSLFVFCPHACAMLLTLICKFHDSTLVSSVVFKMQYIQISQFLGCVPHKEQNKVLENSAGHFLNSLTRGNGEQVEAIKTNGDQVGTHGGRASQPTRKGHRISK